MTDLRIVTEEELCPVLSVLNALEWPVPFERVPELFETLGWTQERRSGGRTSLPVSLQLVSVGQLQGEVSRIEFRISDTLNETDDESEKAVQEHFRQAVSVVAECLGAEPTATPWVSRGARWELEGGRQLNVLQGENVIKLQYWSKLMADVELHERTRGVDPAHNLDDRE